MKKILVRGGIVLVALVMVALVVVFFSLNSIVKKGVETVGPQLAKVDVKLGSAKLSPFSGSGQLTKLFVGNPEGFKSPSAIEVGDLKVSVQIGSVLSDTIVVNEINIQSPEITLEGSLTGNNLSKILDNLSASGSTADDKKKTDTTKKSEKKFIVKDLVLNGAKVHVALTGLGQTINTTLPIPDYHLQNLGTAEGGISGAQLAREILQPILNSSLNAAKNGIASGAKDITNMGKDSVNEVGKAAKSISDLFKKK